MFSCRACVPAALMWFSLSSCAHIEPLTDNEEAAVDAAVLALINALPEKSREQISDEGRLELHLAPEIPSVMRIGDRLIVSVNPTLKDGAVCRVCSVNWITGSPSIAEWTSFATRGTERRATLTARSPGPVRLVVEVCPGAYFKCQQTTIVSRVVQ